MAESAEIFETALIFMTLNFSVPASSPGQKGL